MSKFYFSYLQSNISIENEKSPGGEGLKSKLLQEFEPRESHVYGQLGQFSETLPQNKNAFKESEEGWG